MPKIRSIHPDVCESEKLVDLSDGAERTLWRLTTHSDDDGRGVDNPKLIANKLYPLDDTKTAVEIDGHLDELVKARMLVRYQVGTKRYYEIHDFTDWQKPKYRSESKFPGPEQAEPTPSPDRDQTGGTYGEGPPHGDGEVIGDGEGTPVGNDKSPFVRKLADELREHHGCEFESRDTLYQAFQVLLTAALERLPDERHHRTSMGVIADFVERAQGIALTRESRSHTAKLVRLHSPLDVLHGFGQALEWGAGCTEKYADDPLALSKYVAGVLSKRGAA